LQAGESAARRSKCAPLTSLAPTDYRRLGPLFCRLPATWTIASGYRALTPPRWGDPKARRQGQIFLGWPRPRRPRPNAPR